MNFTFDDIHIYGNVIVENNLFKQYHFPQMLNYYSGNFISFKTMPTVRAFEHTSQYLKDFHSKNQQNHVRYTFPANVEPNKEFINYLVNQAYDYSFNELYILQPKYFPLVKANPDIKVQFVGEGLLDAFLNLQYSIDVEFGMEFAKNKQSIHISNFQKENWKQIVGFYQGKLVGALDLIISNKTVEIDNFVVLEPYRNKGIGTQMQKYVVDHFPEYAVILVAEGEGTAREMYRRQNYKYAGFQYEVLKVYNQI